MKIRKMILTAAAAHLQHRGAHEETMTQQIAPEYLGHLYPEAG